MDLLLGHQGDSVWVEFGNGRDVGGGRRLLGKEG